MQTTALPTLRSGTLADLWSISEIKVLLSQGQDTSILAPSVLIRVMHGMGRVATEFLVCWLGSSDIPRIWEPLYTLWEISKRYVFFELLFSFGNNAESTNKISVSQLTYHLQCNTVIYTYSPRSRYFLLKVLLSPVLLSCASVFTSSNVWNLKSCNRISCMLTKLQYIPSDVEYLKHITFSEISKGTSFLGFLFLLPGIWSSNTGSYVD